MAAPGPEICWYNPYILLGVGLSVGVGIMIIGLAKWGRKIFTGEQPIEPAGCPYASEHPKLQEFMGASLQDRKDMRGFLEDINGKVGKVDVSIAKMEGKLDLLLQGARVRWNTGLIPPDKEVNK